MARRQPLELVIGVRVPAPQLVPPVSFSLEHMFARAGDGTVAFFFITIVLRPILGAEDRPDFLRPDSRFRKMVTPLRRR
jgi:hypothetical protein